ncbi:MAG TPA: hypothetical protein VFE98_04590 [Candidatus Bathyarchaeia archaeon]|nr:hypothetical protein [Candidatus Bathyarchaeia archaeon]
MPSTKSSDERGVGVNRYSFELDQSTADATAVRIMEKPDVLKQF